MRVPGQKEAAGANYQAPDHAPELGKQEIVELRRLELRTSCMPCNAGPFTTDRCRSPQTPLTSRNVRRSPPEFTTVHCGR
jgi:hypothetical protein